jgi:hypothetical protein
VDTKAEKSTNRTRLTVYIKDAAEAQAIAYHVEKLTLYPRVIVRVEDIIGLEAPLTKRRNVISVTNQIAS